MMTKERKKIYLVVLTEFHEVEDAWDTLEDAQHEIIRATAIDNGKRHVQTCSYYPVMQEEGKGLDFAKLAQGVRGALAKETTESIDAFLDSKIPTDDEQPEEKAKHENPKTELWCEICGFKYDMCMCEFFAAQSSSRSQPSNDMDTHSMNIT